MTINPLRSGHVFELSSSSSIHALMNQWVLEGRSARLIRHRQLLVDEVEFFLGRTVGCLEIVDVDIKELPDFLRRPEIASRLRKLIITRTHLERLPEWISELSHLQNLTLEDNYHIDQFPESIGRLSNLKSLSITLDTSFVESQLFSFPSSCRDLRLTHLEIIGISCRSVNRLLRSQRSLNSLHLNNCDYSQVPQEVVQLTDLRILDMTANNIQQIPDDINQLRLLETVSFRNNALTNANQSLFLLNARCNIDLVDNFFNDEELSRIRQITALEDYQGPRFILHDDPIPAEHSGETTETDEKEQENAFSFLYKALGLEKPAIIDALEQDSQVNKAFESLILCLRQSIPYKHSFAPSVYSVLAESLTLAAEDTEYRQACFHVVDGATTTCGDGIIAIILKLDLMRQSILLNLADLPCTIEFILKGKLAMSLLEEVASNRIAEQKIEIISQLRQDHPDLQQELIERLAFEKYKKDIDPVEVFLRYPIALRERLGLPLKLGQMFFSTHARVTAQHLSDAAEYVEKKLDNQNFVEQFLVQDDLWLKVLKLQFPLIFKELDLDQEKLANLPEESAVEDPFVAFAQKKQATLAQLTNQLLAKVSKSSQESQETKRPTVENTSKRYS